jgi:hypothetical protein
MTFIPVHPAGTHVPTAIHGGSAVLTTPHLWDTYLQILCTPNNVQS